MTTLKQENTSLESKVGKLEQANSKLSTWLKTLEDRLLEHNIVFQGVPESTWESEEVCREKIIDIISVFLAKEWHTDQIEAARNIPINLVRRIGSYNSMQIRPVVVEFGCKGDAEYVLDNKRRLQQGIFVDHEYGKETSLNRKLLKPIFNAARCNKNYKGKCRLDGDVLTIHGKEYTTKNLYAFSEDLSCFKVTSRCDQDTFAFFGELSALSNFYQ